MKTKWYEESEGVTSSSRVFAGWLVAAGILQIGVGCVALFTDGSPAALSAWGAASTTFGIGLQMKNNAKKIEEK